MLTICITYSPDSYVIEQVVNSNLVYLTLALLDDQSVDSPEKECYEDNAIWMINNVLADEHLIGLDSNQKGEIAFKIIKETCFLSLMHRITINKKQIPSDFLCTVLLCMSSLLQHPYSLGKSESLLQNVRLIITGLLVDKINPESDSQNVIFYGAKLFNAALESKVITQDQAEFLKILSQIPYIRILERTLSPSSGVEKEDNELMNLGFKIFGQLLSTEDF